MRFVLAGYGSRGDVQPCVAVGQELQRRGHDVCMAVSPDKIGFVESAGLTAVGYGPDTRDQVAKAAGIRLYAQNPLSELPEVMGHGIQVWAQKSETLTSLAAGADLLLAGMNEQRLAAEVARYHGIPLASLHFFPSQILKFGLGLPKDTEYSPQNAPLEIQTYDELCFPELAGVWAERAARRPFVGALTLEVPADADDEVLAWVADGTPPIYLGFGSTPVNTFADTVAMIGAACAELGERALICSGPNEATGIPHADHVKIVDAVSHALVFPACRAVVHHGGAGTTAAGLRAGIPTLILWLWLDQPVWAAAVSQLGAGYGRPLAATTQRSLTEDLRLILSPECVARAREVGAQMTTPSESLVMAADLVEEAARVAPVG